MYGVVCLASHLLRQEQSSFKQFQVAFVFVISLLLHQAHTIPLCIFLRKLRTMFVSAETVRFIKNMTDSIEATFTQKYKRSTLSDLIDKSRYRDCVRTIDETDMVSIVDLI